jgi:hypothetical protein
MLGATPKLFDAMNLTYYLTSGSLIGEWRCEDVLPWSEDADIHVPAKDLAEAYLKIFGDSRESVPEDTMITHEDNPLVPPELVIFSWGWNSSYLKEQPLGIGDRATGFYIDVWIEEQGESTNGTQWVERYWKHAPHECEPREGYSANRCFKFPADIIYPLRDCTVAGVVHKCPRDTSSFLGVEFGDGFTETPRQYWEV